jgi:Rrf2 family nitric oxide-sensitive transcriptional repressor
MKLNKKEELVFKILVYLAQKDDTIEIKNIASGLNESYDHTKKITYLLIKSGFVVSSRGRGGGVKLSKDPKDIDLFDVIKTFHTVENKCDSQECGIYDLGKLREIIFEKESAYINGYRGINLVDVV